MNADTNVQAHPNDLLPATPEDAELQRQVERVLAYKRYRKHTRPFRRTFRGIITRKDAERFYITRARKSARALQALEEARNAA